MMNSTSLKRSTQSNKDLEKKFEWRQEIKNHFGKLSDPQSSNQSYDKLILYLQDISDDCISFFMSCLLDASCRNELDRKCILKLLNFVTATHTARVLSYQSKIITAMVERLSKTDLWNTELCIVVFGVLAHSFGEYYYLNSNNSSMTGGSKGFQIQNYLDPCFKLLLDYNKNTQVAAALAIESILCNIVNIDKLRMDSIGISSKLLSLLINNTTTSHIKCHANLLVCLEKLILQTKEYLSSHSNDIIPKVLSFLSSGEFSVRLAAISTLQAIGICFHRDHYKSQYLNQILTSLNVALKTERVKAVIESVKGALEVFQSTSDINSKLNLSMLTPPLPSSQNQNHQFNSIDFQVKSLTNSLGYQYQHQHHQQQNLFIQSPKLNNSVLLSPTRKPNQPPSNQQPPLVNMSNYSPPLYYQSLSHQKQQQQQTSNINIEDSSSVKKVKIEKNDNNINDHLYNNIDSTNPSPLFNQFNSNSTINTNPQNNKPNTKIKEENVKKLSTLDLDSNETITTTTTTSFISTPKNQQPPDENQSQTILLNKILSTLNEFMEKTSKDIGNLSNRMDILEESLIIVQEKALTILENQNNIDSRNDYQNQNNYR